MTTRFTVAPPADHPRRGFSDWWYLIFVGILVFQPLLAPGTTGADWAITAVLAVIGGAL